MTEPNRENERIVEYIRKEPGDTYLMIASALHTLSVLLRAFLILKPDAQLMERITDESTAFAIVYTHWKQEKPLAPLLTPEGGERAIAEFLERAERFAERMQK